MPRRRLWSSSPQARCFAPVSSPAQTGAAAKPEPPAKPDKVVIIVVDALSKEIVEKYDMQNVKTLMADGVDTPHGYLGHTGSVTVVTHNVITSGMLPKHMGWTNEGYRDVDGVLGPVGGLYITSNFGYDQMAPLQKHAGYPHLSDYLDDTGKVFTVSPKGYAAYGLAGPGSREHLGRHLHERSHVQRRALADAHRRARAAVVPRRGTAVRGTGWSATRATTRCSSPLSSTRRPTTATSWATSPGTRAATSGPPTPCSTSWTNEENAWSGIFVSLPGVDKAAHMWGGVNDPEGATPGYNPMTHMKFATATADAQVGRIMKALKDSGSSTAPWSSSPPTTDRSRPRRGTGTATSSRRTTTGTSTGTTAIL